MEQAFYLTFGPKKPMFVDSFWDVVDWEQVN